MSATTERNKQTVLQYVAAFNAGDIVALEKLFTADAVVYGVLGWGPVAQVMNIWRELHSGLAVELTVEQMIAEDDVVAVRYTERGQFVGPFQDMEPTGRSYELLAIEWYVLRDGLIQRRWGARDAASQARQIGMPLM